MDTSVVPDRPISAAQHQSRSRNALPERSVALLVFTGSLGIALLVAKEWWVYRRALMPADLTPSIIDSTLILWSVWSKSLILLMPVLAGGLLLAWAGRVRIAWIWMVIGSSVVSVYIAMDLIVFDEHGKHLIELVSLLDREDVIHIGGGLGRWMPTLAIVSVIVIGSAAALVVVSRRLAQVLVTRAQSSGDTRKLVLITIALCALAIWGPTSLRNLTGRAALYERISYVMPFNLFGGALPWGAIESDDPVIRALDVELREVYQRRFLDLTRPMPADPTAVIDGPLKPNVVLIILESWNHEMAMSGVMPRLTRWASTGMVFNRHYAATNHSETGMFTLLYARNPWVYRPTIDARIKPQLVESFRRSGYATLYATGHPFIWHGREHFTDTRTFDRVSYIQADKKVKWHIQDREVIARLSEFLRRGDGPRLGVTFLLSTHLFYSHPPEYDGIALSDSQQIQNFVDQANLGSKSKRIGFVRYLDTLRFMDDLLMDFIESLDPMKNIVIVTGDHGESLYQDGKHGHWSKLSDAQTMTPMMIVGPGVPKMSLDTLTTHMDLLPTLLHILNGRSVPIAHCHGRDLLEPLPFEDEALLAYLYRHEYIRLMAIDGDERLAFQVDPITPRLRLTGFTDRFANALTVPGKPVTDVSRWLGLIERQIDLICR